MLKNHKVRIIPLGGASDVTKNMYLYEIYDGEKLLDIIIVDCGIGFPKEKDLGVELVIPDISYLHDKTDKIRAILLTHGHEDHISSLKFHYKTLGSPPVYSTKLTAHFVESQFAQLGQKIKVQQIQYGKEYFFGGFSAYYIHLTHSIPDTAHIVIKTPIGTIYHGSDYKFDLTPPHQSPPDFYAITKAGHDRVLCLLTDCLGVEKAGISKSESAVGQTFIDAIRDTRGIFMMSTFSSNISRIRQCVEAAAMYQRKICFLGRSMKQNTTLAEEIGYLPNVKKMLIEEKDINKFAPSKVCLIMTGSQGQVGSALSKIAERQHRFVKIVKGDKVLFSSDPIPGNEEPVDEMIEKLAKQGAQVIYTSIQGDLHASGHASRDEMKLLLHFVKPRFIIPIGGTPRHQRRYREMASDMGWNPQDVFTLVNGDNVWFEKNKVYLGKPIPQRSVYVDAYGVDKVGNVILRDRKTLAQEGFVFTVVPVYADFTLCKAPEISSRGFVDEKTEKDMYMRVKRLIADSIADFRAKPPAGATKFTLQQNITRKLEHFFFKKTGRRPLIAVEVVQLEV